MYPRLYKCEAHLSAGFVESYRILTEFFLRDINHSPSFDARPVCLGANFSPIRHWAVLCARRIQPEESVMDQRIYMHKDTSYKPAALFDSDATDGLRSMILLDLVRKHRLVVVCCEPGYCTAATLRSVGIQAERMGYRYHSRDFSDSVPMTACDSLIRLARDVCSKTINEEDLAVVSINLLPPCDEVEVERLSKAIERLIKTNCLVIVTMLPEARQIIEELPSALLLTADDLCDVSSIARDGSGFVKSGEGLTRGIPVLAHSLASYKGDFSPASLPLSYWDGLGKLLESGLRNTLCEDELRLRLAIALLGQGTFAELEAVLGDGAQEFLYDLSLWAPFYGVSTDTCSFSCLTMHSHQWLNSELPAFSVLIAGQQPLLRECLSALGVHGEMDRMAALLRFASEMTAAEIVLEWAPELVDAGHMRLVASVITPLKQAKSADDERVQLIDRMVLALGSERVGADFGCGSIACFYPMADEKTSLCLGLIGLRECLRSTKNQSMVIGAGCSLLKTRLEVHGEAMNALVAGRFGRALELLAPVFSAEAPTTVTDCLLQVDFAVAQIFACGVSWDDRSQLDKCRQYLSSRGYYGLLGYVWALELVIEALCSSPSGTAALVRSKAAKSGDLLVKALSHVSEVFGLLRRRPSAYVLAAAGASRSACRDVSWPYAARVGDVLNQVAHFQMGESAGLYALGENDGVGSISEVVGELTHDMKSGAVPLDARVRPVPVDDLWLVVALCDGMGEFSRALEDQVPVEWRRALDVARKNSLNPVKLMGGPDGTGRELRGFAPGGRGIRLTLFGEFGLAIDGKKVSDWYLGVRDAKPLLEFLALQPGHMASRERIALQLWPEVSDERKARQKVYSATSAARKALLKHGFTGDLFSSNKATKSVGLTNDAVTCDVDEFICHANAAIEGNGDARICDSALKAEGLYAGDLCILSEDQSGYLATRREQLKQLYADAMIAGGEAALRLDKKRLAARFANDALYIDDLREDAMTLLVRALRRSGRSDEAVRRYRRFARRLETKTGRVPSAQLQASLIEPLGTILRSQDTPSAALGGAS
ncbi:AfsR/SARP family transcriptional regulator [Paratractidigestivibacter sp.]|uniref:AfsR/SARP family transcriptional regulator n=2 Tax=Paratractidigestivibacter sp. TaxID=2847316 RepID=UPI002ACB1284|nr:BTAD domain-containing putative transcriptional regulator [Paratractidigestivibacter sp.]